MSGKSRRQFLQTSAAAAVGVRMSEANLAAESVGTPLADKSKTSFRERLLECLGGPWPDPVELKPQLLKTEIKDGCRLEWVTYQVEPGETVAAILIVPAGVSAQSPAPGICVWHQHAGQWHLGKSEPAGLAGDPMHHTGLELAKLGYVVLCPDALCFEERQDPEGKLKAGQYERFEFLKLTVGGTCMAWKNILDMRRAVDYIASRPEVRADRLGCYGHSMGSTHTWMVGPWEERLKCLVGNCCLPTYKAIARTKILHCFPNFIPGLHACGDTPDIAGLIAPRRLHLNFGELDGGSPIAEVQAGLQTIRNAYQSAGASEQFTSFIEPETGHVLSPAMWELTKNAFATTLK